MISLLARGTDQSAFGARRNNPRHGTNAYVEQVLRVAPDAPKGQDAAIIRQAEEQDANPAPILHQPGRAPGHAIDGPEILSRTAGVRTEALKRSRSRARYSYGAERLL